MKLTKIVAACLIFGMSTTCVAASYTSVIKSISANSQGAGIMIETVDNPPNSDCGVPNPTPLFPVHAYLGYPQGSFSLTQAGFDNIYALALTALASGKPVTINYIEVPNPHANPCYLVSLKLLKS